MYYYVLYIFLQKIFSTTIFLWKIKSYWYILWERRKIQNTCPSFFDMLALNNNLLRMKIYALIFMSMHDMNTVMKYSMYEKG